MARPSVLDDTSWVHLGEQSRFLPIVRVPPGKIGIVGYSRVSTTIQANEGMSIDAQVSNIRDYANKQGYIVKTICVDLGLSGGTADRPGLKMARLVLERGDIFVIPALSRMTRSSEDAIAIKNELQAKGCGFMVLDITIDLNDKVGQLLFGIINQFNEFERSEIKGRISVVMQAMKREGTLISKPHYGYMSAGKKKQLVPNSEEQRVIQYLLQETEKDPEIGPSHLASLLNEHPEFSAQSFRRKAKKWYPDAVRNIMVYELKKLGKTPQWNTHPGRKPKVETLEENDDAGDCVHEDEHVASGSTL